MTTTPERGTRFAAWLALAGLGLTSWSVLNPTPWSIVLALSLGQACGLASLVVFGLAVWADVGKR